ncbi:MAG: hypothetical protein KDD47_21415, partial [Acidobacteria bacterium]|nr:hypothetical protein [Acidobacteriota bacterium]
PTRASVEHLVRPLELDIAGKWSRWQVSTLLRGAANKAALAGLLGGGSPPSLLFTASHAVRYPAESPRQATHQGALLSADWPGRRAWQGKGALPDDFLFSGEDVASGTRLDGLIAFHFACYSAGTPHLDPYHDRAPRVAAAEPFVAHLPKRLLRQGALAVVGHVDVAFEQSFLWYDSDSQPVNFRSALDALMSGAPVGHAMESFTERFSLLGAILAEASWKARRNGSEDEDLKRLRLWSAFQDSRHYLVLGDPAARLSV